MENMIDRRNWRLLDRERSKRKVRGRKKTMKKEIMVNSPLTIVLPRNNKKIQFDPPSKKSKFLYSVVSSPQDHSKHFTLYFPDRPVHSETILASLGSIQPYATINARRLLIHISNTVYSQVLIYIAE